MKGDYEKKKPCNVITRPLKDHKGLFPGGWAISDQLPTACLTCMASVPSRSGGCLGQLLLGICRWPLRAPTPL